MAPDKSQANLTRQRPMIMWTVLFNPSRLPYIACPLLLSVLKALSISAAGCCAVTDARPASTMQKPREGGGVHALQQRCETSPGCCERSCVGWY